MAAGGVPYGRKCRSFVNGACETENLRVMLRSTIEMAQELGLSTVAEGVSSQEELRLLRQCGCTYAQGWLFAKALPGAELKDWLAGYEIRRSRSPG